MTSTALNGNHGVAHTTTLHRYLTLTAFTTAEEPLTITTWFAAQGGRLFIALPATSAIVGAIRQNAQVALLPSSRNGEARGHALTGEARILPQFETAEAHDALDRKYGIVAGVSHLMSTDQGLGGEVLIEVIPEASLGADDLLREATPEASPNDARVRIVGLAVAGAVLGAVIAVTLIARRRQRA